MAEKLNTYRATEAAGDFVAGKRVPRIVVEPEIRDDKGRVTKAAVTKPDPAWTVRITERQAQYEVLNGVLELVPDEGPKPKGKPKPDAAAIA